MAKFRGPNAPLVFTLIAVVVLALVITVVVALTSPAATPAPATPTTAKNASTIVITRSTCATGWHVPGSGRPTFTVRNETADANEVQLVAVASQLVYGKIEVLAPQTARPLQVALPPGQYQWQCGSLRGPATLSATGTVSGPPIAAHPVRQENETAATIAVVAYRSQVSAGLRGLAQATGDLVQAVQEGSRGDMQAAWLRAHLAYERLGAAYGTFGKYADKIDGRASGFPVLEHDLWAGAPTDAVVAPAQRLDADVRALVAAFPTQPTSANDISLRAHEILENTLQFELTGATDRGSHTNLATARANVDGTRMALSVLAPQLRAADPRTDDSESGCCVGGGGRRFAVRRSLRVASS